MACKPAGAIKAKAVGEAIRRLHGLKKLPVYDTEGGKYMLARAIHTLGEYKAELKAELAEAQKGRA